MKSLSGLALLVVVAASLVVMSLAQGGQFPPVSIGTNLYRDYTVYDPLPTNVSAATAAGWSAASSYCNANLGLAYTYGGAGATSDNPLTLFFTAGGQIAGMGVNLYGDPPKNLIETGYWQYISDGVYFLSVTFRESSQDVMCDDSYTDDYILGDRLTINSNNLTVSLPLTESEAQDAQWTKGSCFSTMGYHYFYDLATAPSMSWEAANLLPIVLMYNNGSLNAFFFASSVVQQGLLSAHFWDPIPLLDILMCKNWCDSSCTWSDTSAWSTLHVYLNDYQEVTCPNNCKIACCDSSFI